MLLSAARTRARSESKGKGRRAVVGAAAFALLAAVPAVGAGPAYAVTSGTVVAWGSDGNGQTPAPSGLSGVVSVAAALRTSFAVKEDGTVAAWGDDEFGLVTQAATLTGVTQVAGGERHALALKADGTVVAWGGATLFDDARVVPADLSGVVQVAANRFSSFALTSDGTVVTWGYIGLGAPTFTGVKKIAANGCQLVVLRNDDTVGTWGSYCNGNPVGDAPSGTYLDIAGGIGFTAAVRADGTVVTWGSQALDPQSQGVVPPSGLTGVVEIAAGERRVLVRKTDGTLTAWGFYLSDHEVPAGLSGVVDIASGDRHHLALTTGTPADATPPVVTPAITGTAGSGGWYRSDVSVSWTVTDPDSTVSSTEGCDTVSFVGDTAGTTVTCSATSAGGTTSKSVTIKRDTVAPVLAPTVSPSSVVVGGTATASANATDALSGIASQGCSTPSTSVAGTVAVPCTATDLAGNTATANAQLTVLAGTVTGPTLNYPASVKPKVGTYVRVLAGLTGGKAYGYVVVKGSLPLGLSLDTSSGTVRGVPRAQGLRTVTIGVKNSSGEVVATDVVKFSTYGGYLVRFSAGSSSLTSLSKAVLREAAKAVNAGPGRSLEVRGYAAYINGDIAAAKLIATARAESCKLYLRSLGVGQKIAVSIGVGYATTSATLEAQRKATVKLRLPS